ncbi:MAG: DUF4864 domain-containing protein [Pseudomonadota bacterium]
MKRLILAAAVGVVLAGPLAADTKDDVTGVIQSQIEAFQADDFDRAFTFAAPGIKRMFGTSDRFGMMVQQGYPMVWRPGRVDYLDLREGPTGPVQRVMITDQAGRTHLLDYYMSASEDGWQISGVQFVQAPGVGA